MDVVPRRLLKEYSGSRTGRLCAFRQRRGRDGRRSTVISAAPELKGEERTTTRRSNATARRRDAGSTAQPPCAHDPEGNDLTS